MHKPEDPRYADDTRKVAAFDADDREVAAASRLFRARETVPLKPEGSAANDLPK